MFYKLYDYFENETHMNFNKNEIFFFWRKKNENLLIGSCVHIILRCELPVA